MIAGLVPDRPEGGERLLDIAIDWSRTAELYEYDTAHDSLTREGFTIDRRPEAAQ